MRTGADYRQSLPPRRTQSVGDGRGPGRGCDHASERHGSETKIWVTSNTPNEALRKPISDPKAAQPEPNRLKETQETRGAGGEVEAAADGALPRAPRGGALLL